MEEESRIEGGKGRSFYVNDQRKGVVGWSSVKKKFRGA